MAYIPGCEDCVRCPNCGGKGQFPSHRVPCPEPIHAHSSPLREIRIPPYFPRCGGSGQVVVNVTCSTCNGRKGQACDWHRREYPEPEAVPQAPEPIIRKHESAGSMDDRQAAIDSGSSSPLWLIIAGVVILIIGLNALVFGPLGLVLLIVGGLLALAGCVVIALRKWTRS